MMRLVRKHISEHGTTSRPHRRPTPARKSRHTPPGTIRQCIGQHTQALPRTFAMCHRSLLHRAAKRVEGSRTLQVGRGILEPHQSAVVQMRKDGANRPPPSPRARHLSPPRAPVQMRQQNLVHRVVDGIRLHQNRRKFSRTAASRGTPIRLPRHTTTSRCLTIARHYQWRKTRD